MESMDSMDAMESMKSVGSMDSMRSVDSIAPRCLIFLTYFIDHAVICVGETMLSNGSQLFGLPSGTQQALADLRALTFILCRARKIESSSVESKAVGRINNQHSPSKSLRMIALDINFMYSGAWFRIGVPKDNREPSK